MGSFKGHTPTKCFAASSPGTMDASGSRATEDLEIANSKTDRLQSETHESSGAKSTENVNKIDSSANCGERKQAPRIRVNYRKQSQDIEQA